MVVALEIVKRNKEKVARPATRDGEDGDLKMRDQEITSEPVGLKAS